MFAGKCWFVFTLPYLCFLWIWKLYRNNFTLGISTCHVSVRRQKNVKAKTWKLNVTQKNIIAQILPTHYTKWIDIHKSQTMIFWTGWSKFLFPKRSVRKHRAFRFWLMSQKNLKSKDVFDITGRVFSKTAVNNIFLLPLSRGNVTRHVKINIFMLGFNCRQYCFGLLDRDMPIFSCVFFLSLRFNFFDVDY